MNNKTVDVKVFENKLFNKWKNEYKLLFYDGSAKRSLFEHTLCNHEFWSLPTNILRQRSPCPYCNLNSHKNTDIFKYQLETERPGEFTLLSEYIGATCRVKVKCNTCGIVFYPLPRNLINKSHNCPYCSKEPLYLTQNAFEKRCEDVHGTDYLVIGDYVGSTKKIRIKHLSCEYEYEPIASDFIRDNSKCPICEKNSGMITSEVVNIRLNNLYYGQYILLDDFKNTNEEFHLKCTFCDNDVYIRGAYVLSGDARCPICGKGRSYPDRFMMSVFEQSNVSYLYQLKRKHLYWCQNYIYDFYLPNYKIICEINGMQHYADAWYPKEVTYNNDLNKYKNAKPYVDNYIIIDARYSKKDYIKNNIINSKLSDFINMDKIDWDECDRYGKISSTKEIRDLYQQNKTNKEISEILNISENTIKNKIINVGKKGA